MSLLRRSFLTQIRYGVKGNCPLPSAATELQLTVLEASSAGETRMKGERIGVWITVGIGVGVAIGAKTHSMALCICVGVLAGAVTGVIANRQRME